MERRACDRRKVTISNPGRIGMRIFFSFLELTFYADSVLFDVRATPVLPQWHVKDPGHSAKGAGGRLHLNTYTLDPTKLEWADYAAVQAQCGNLSGNELTRNLSGNTQSQSSQLGKPLLTDPGLKSGTSARKLISTFKKSAGGE